MPTSEEKQRHKAIQNELGQKINEEKLASLPMPKEMLAGYFDHLDQQLTEHGCDDTLRFTQAFAASHNLTFEPIKQWSSNYGGYCGCEALANVEQEYESL